MTSEEEAFELGMKLGMIKQMWKDIEETGKVKDIMFSSPEKDWIEKEPPVYEEDEPEEDVL